MSRAGRPSQRRKAMEVWQDDKPETTARVWRVFLKSRLFTRPAFVLVGVGVFLRAFGFNGTATIAVLVVGIAMGVIGLVLLLYAIYVNNRR